jgi:NADH-quinone oxidoreductase subunit L
MTPMEEFHYRHPGWPHVAATVLPLVVGGFTVLAAAAGGLAGRRDDGPRSRVGPLLNVGGLAVSAFLSVIGLIGFYDVRNKFGEQFEWVRVGESVLTVGYHIDALTALLFVVVGVVATLVAVFSLGYMADEQARRVKDHETGVERSGRPDRFFAYLSLFVAAMYGLLLADNLLQLFICWELVGTCSYLLVGFYHERPTAAAAAIKAFVVNRIGDAGFLIAIVIAWTAFGTLDLRRLSQDVPESMTVAAVLEIREGRDLHSVAEALRNESWVHVPDVLKWFRPWPADRLTYPLWLIMGGGLFLGAVGKSAQVPLHVWLPDAMAGPTPVSALIHAATMVAAGVYLVARCLPLFAPEVQLAVAYTGAVTLVLGATAACVQNDIKKVLAYSTCSQLGMMMLALGVGVAAGGWAAGMFHLVTHACFKALLFLCAGAVIYALHHEQDVRYMGGLRSRLPVTAVAMMAGALAAAGCPPFAGWYSKETVLSATAAFALAKPHHAALFALPLLTAGLTAFYMARLWLLVFAGKPRDAELHAHAHDPPAVMLVPLLALVTLALAVGLGDPPWEPKASYLGRGIADFSRSIDTPSWGEWRLMRDAGRAVGRYHLAIEAAAGLMALVGALVALVRYGLREPTFAAPPAAGRRFFVNAWGFDAVYRVLAVRPVRWLASMTAVADKRPGSADGHGSDPAARRFDPSTLDGWLSAVGLSALAAGASARRLQAGFLRGYVLALGLTVVGLLGMLAVLLP